MAGAHLIEVFVNLTLAWVAGSLIGLERTYNGRVAGFRTHGLVSLAAAMVTTLAYLPVLRPEAVAGLSGVLDPSRLSQGVMTGLGFLGAGVIFKEGVSVQGLTTAASIWATAAIGEAFGVGLIWPGLFATGLVLVILIILRTLEALLPSRAFGLATFRFEASKAPSQSELVAMLGGHGVLLEDFSFALTEGGKVMEYRTEIHAPRRLGFAAIAEHLKGAPGLIEYELARISK